METQPAGADSRDRTGERGPPSGLLLSMCQGLEGLGDESGGKVREPKLVPGSHGGTASREPSHSGI